MSFGKMRCPITILVQSAVSDSEGYTHQLDTVLASVRAYKEERHGTEKWASRAAFSEATCLFRFRMIPGLVVSTAHVIECAGVRYRIIFIENVRNRGMYIEALADRITPSKR
ncbi:hypothetical protein AGMMS49992_25540 [Clostridia bacterium]|nr:hypothetical protein AGMMS49992_25540 [Clostridia bacterium]